MAFVHQKQGARLRLLLCALVLAAYVDLSDAKRTSGRTYKVDKVADEFDDFDVDDEWTGPDTDVQGDLKRFKSMDELSGRNVLIQFCTS